MRRFSQWVTHRRALGAGTGLALAIALGALVAGLPPAAATTRAAARPRVLTVPSGGSIGKVVKAARPGDVVEISAGTYHEEVRIRTSGITLRGVDRNAVVLDGTYTKANGVTVSADRVAVENLTVHGYTQNGVVFVGPDAAQARGRVPADAVYGSGNAVLRGFRARFVTAYNNGLYGIYAFAARDGLIEDSYVSGHPDSGIYVGQCNPCHTVVRRVIAERNAIGYYGTNATDVVVVQSEFRGNRLGLAPNSQRMEKLAPQARTVVVGNVVADNDDPATPPIAEGFFGAGIAVGGGTENVIARNRVTGHSYAGITVQPLNDFAPAGNRIEGNVLADNATDLAYVAATGTGAAGNCFAGNRFASSVPTDIETALPCGAPSSFLGPTSLPARPAPPGVEYRTMRPPPPQPTMPGATGRSRGGAGPIPTIDVDAIPVPS